jgi:hypothetical protein
MVAAADAARELNEGVNDKRIRSHFRYYDTEPQDGIAFSARG